MEGVCRDSLWTSPSGSPSTWSMLGSMNLELVFSDYPLGSF